MERRLYPATAHVALLFGPALFALGCGGNPGATDRGATDRGVPEDQEVEPAALVADSEPAMEETTQQGGLPRYRFDDPNRTWKLPNKLKEVSGITLTGASTLGCVQDERGSLYTFDLESGAEMVRQKFGPKGDYEGLAGDGERLLVLRSDGALLVLNLDGTARGESMNPMEDVPFVEFESVAFEPAKRRWLVMPKDAVSDDLWKKDDRVIYGIGLEDLTLADEPALVLSRKAIIQAAEDHHWPLPTRVNKKGKEKSDFDFRPSDLVVHPDTGDYFILSGRDRTLIAVSPSGELLGTAVFPPSILAQPEGLAFYPNGDLLIASEGISGESRQEGHGTETAQAVIIRFSFLPL